MSVQEMSEVVLVEPIEPRKFEFNEDKNPVVRLAGYEYELATEIGVRRFVANWGRPDSRNYLGNPGKEEDRNAQVASAICELAVAKWTNLYWHATVWHWTDHQKYRHFPDVGDNIEVRRTRGSTVEVRRSDRDKIVWGARTIDEEWKSVEILGWTSVNDLIAADLLLGERNRIALIDLMRPWAE